jgi:hypothetical protein
MLVLAAGIRAKEGPGRLVSAIAQDHAGEFPIPVDDRARRHLTDAEIDALS